MRLLILLFLVLPSFFYAQNGYKVSVIVKNLAKQPLDFGSIQATQSKTFSISNKMITKPLDTIIFTSKEPIGGGFYYLNLPNLKKRIDFILDNNDTLQIELNSNDISKTLFKNSPINTYYQQISTKITAQPDSVNSMNNRHLANYILLQKKFNALKNNPNQDFLTYREQYFDVNWEQENYAHLPNLMAYLYMYFFYSSRDYAQYQENAQYVLSKMQKNSDNFNATLDWMFANLEYLKFEHYQDLYKSLADNYLTSENEKSNLIDHYKVNRNVEIYKSLPNGSQAPEFTLKNKLNENVALSSILKQKQYTLIVFFDSKCTHCKQRIPIFNTALKEVNNLTKVAILTPDDDDFSRWDEFISITGIQDWINLKIGSSDKAVQESYHATAFPSFFLLDQNGKIIEKPDKPNDILIKVTH